MNKKQKITIGVPVFNGEKFLEKCLDSILNQTRVDFEVIISDNASTDSTLKICKIYEKKDYRIKCISQRKNVGAINNFKKILENATGDYFLFAAVDNYFEPTFLEKCSKVLDSDLKTVGCISKIGIDDQYVDCFKKEKKILKKIGIEFRKLNTVSILGNYENRIKQFLKEWQWEMIYSLYRTDELKKGAIWEMWTGFDGAFVLNMLKYGEIKVVNEILFYSFPHGESSKGLLHMGKSNPTKVGKIFPFYPLTKWCLNNLGRYQFFKNITHFLRLNMDGIFLQIVSIYQSRKK